jgi:hypothetical protein
MFWSLPARLKAENIDPNASILRRKVINARAKKGQKTVEEFVGSLRKLIAVMRSYANSTAPGDG